MPPARAAAHVALRWLGRSGETPRLHLRRAARERRTASRNVLAALGLERGERVFALTGRIPELYVAALGTLKHGGVFSRCSRPSAPSRSASALELGAGRVLVTTRRSTARKVAALRASGCPSSSTSCSSASARRGPRSTARSTSARCWRRRAPSTRSRRPIPRSRRCCTSRAARPGTPKGAVHVHEAVVAHHATGALALDLHPATCSGARPIRAGSPAPPTGSSRRSRTA